MSEAEKDQTARLVQQPQPEQVHELATHALAIVKAGTFSGDGVEMVAAVKAWLRSMGAKE